jgi:hypothetical protein
MLDEAGVVDAPPRSRLSLIFLAGLAGTLLAGCGSDTSAPSRDGGAGTGASSGGSAGAVAAGGTPSSGGNSGNGGRSAGGTSSSGDGGRTTGGATGSGGSTSCPPECLVANECVTACGQTPRSYGCCPCPAAMINARTCSTPSNDAGANGVSCDTRSVVCKRVAPTCPAEQVPSIEGQCYGPCVSIDACACNVAEDCPAPDQYTCHLSQKRCGPFVN